MYNLFRISTSIRSSAKLRTLRNSLIVIPPPHSVGSKLNKPSFPTIMAVLMLGLSFFIACQKELADHEFEDFDHPADTSDFWASPLFSTLNF